MFAACPPPDVGLMGRHHENADAVPFPVLGLLRRKDRYVTEPLDFMGFGDDPCNLKNPLKSKGLRRPSWAGAGRLGSTSRAS